MDFFREFFQPGDLVYDVGANEGVWTRMFLEHGAGRIIAVEPQIAMIRKMESLFPGQPIDYLNAALGSHNGQAQLYECSAANSLASLTDILAKARFSMYRWRRGTVVQVTTLDAMIAHYGEPRFVKIDVEGYEEQVLLGLSTPINGVCFEYTQEAMNETVRAIARLNSLGDYQYSYNFGDYPSFQVGWTSSDDVVRQLYDHASPQLWGNIYARLRSD